MAHSQIARERMSRPHDARAIRSRDALRAALLKLVQTTPLENITIREITNTANVSYPVFFRRYASKEELFNDIAEEEVRQLLAKAMPISDSGIAIMCAHIQENRALWSALLTTGAATAMRSEFMRISREIASNTPRRNPWIPLELGTPFVTSGIFEILAWWLHQSDNYPISNVIKIMDALIVNPMMNRIEIELE